MMLIWSFLRSLRILSLKLWHHASDTGLTTIKINLLMWNKTHLNITVNPFWWASLSLQERLMYLQSQFPALNPACLAGLRHRGRYFSRLGWICLRGINFFMTPIVDSYRIPLVHSNKNHSFCACFLEPLGTMSWPVFSAKFFKDIPNFVENCQ